jgi:hypothetical protein
VAQARSDTETRISLELLAQDVEVRRLERHVSIQIRDQVEASGLAQDTGVNARTLARPRTAFVSRNTATDLWDNAILARSSREGTVAVAATPSPFERVRIRGQ